MSLPTLSGHRKRLALTAIGGLALSMHIPLVRLAERGRRFVNGYLIDSENAQIVAFVASVARLRNKPSGRDALVRDFSVSLAR